MKYNTIAYERQRTIRGDLQTARVELTVEPGDEPHAVMELAQAFVESQLGIKTDALVRNIDNLKNEESNLKTKINNLEKDLAEFKQRWEKAKDFLQKHGVSTENLESDIPF